MFCVERKWSIYSSVGLPFFRLRWTANLSARPFSIVVEPNNPRKTMASNKAAWLDGKKHKLRIGDAEMPKPGPDDIVVKY